MHILSRNHFYNRIENFSCKQQEINTFLDILKEYFKSKDEQLGLLIKIQANLKEDTIEDRLCKFSKANGLIEDFFKDFRFIAIELNNNDQYFLWDLFFKYGSLKFFTECFRFMMENMQKLDDISFEKYEFDNLINLSEIIYMTIRCSIKCTNNYLSEGLFDILLNSFKDHRLIKMLDYIQKPVLIKMLRIFYFLSKNIYFVKNFSIELDKNSLRNNLDLFKNLTPNQDPLTENGLLRMYFISVSYLQEMLVPKEDLINMEIYADLGKKGLLQSLFKENTQDMIQNCQYFYKEVVLNESNEIERARVHKLTSIKDKNTQRNLIPSFFMTDLLSNALVLWSTDIKTDEIKSIGYQNQKRFFSLIIIHGFDIEKILSLKILSNFCTVESLRKEIFDDTELINYLKDLKNKLNGSQDQAEVRLRKMIEIFFQTNNEFPE